MHCLTIKCPSTTFITLSSGSIIVLVFFCVQGTYIVVVLFIYIYVIFLYVFFLLVEVLKQPPRMSCWPMLIVFLCSPVTTCPELKVPHGNLSHYGPLPVGDSVNVTCHLGFMLIGTKQLMCLQGREYNHPVPECVGRECFALLVTKCTLSSVHNWWSL